MSGTETDFHTWFEWIDTAARCNEHAADSRATAWERKSSGPASEDSPGSDFNRRGSWAETGLEGAGWKWEQKRSGEDAGLLCRPGKERGVSASAGMVTSKDNGWPLFFCWSTSVTEFVPEQPYSRFAVYAILKHGGDYSAAAKDLSARGYGRRQPEVKIEWGTGPGEPPGASAAGDKAPGEDRGFKWMSELRVREQNDKWLWHGYVSRGGVTMLSALWKAGKSTLLSHLLRAFDGRSEQFLGLPITASRVLYVSEEHEELWAERRDDLNIGDHVGMVCRPFRGRPSPAEWAAFIGKLVGIVQKHRFDLVVMDTISKLWPVREENDAGQVEDALMPVWAITDGGAGLVLVHHNRKSDGKEFTGSRGSGGLPAFCETLIEFRRASDESKDRKRLLTGGGRYRETPDKLLIELKPEGYVSHGDPDEMSPEAKVTFGVASKQAAADTATPEDKVRAVLTESPDPWLTSDCIRDALRASNRPIRDAAVSKAIGEMYFRKELAIRGKQRSKTSPQQFALCARVGNLPSGSTPGDAWGMTSGNETGEADGGCDSDISFPTHPKGRNETEPDDGPEKEAA
jgi:hypothetical protein